jgi:hypothetical protein
MHPEIYYCIDCNEVEMVCDDRCVQCEINFHLAEKEEADDLIEEYKNNPTRLSDWEPVIRALLAARAK